MPEYLAPGVYVEEVDTGSKPIEGVSTSTAGMIGVTERGPINVPILVTSYGEYVRWFGERLNPQDYSSGDERHCFLPHAAEGFFTNSGKRAYIVRVLDTSKAQKASTFLVDRGAITSAATCLLHDVASASSEIYVADSTGLVMTVPPTWLQIGQRSDVEYRQIQALPATANEVPLNLPLAFAHDATTHVRHLSPGPASIGDALNLTADAKSGDTKLSLDDIGTLNSGGGDLIRIGDTNVGDEEYVFTSAADKTANQIKSVTVNGWNRKTKKPITGKASLDDPKLKLNRDLYESLKKCDAREERVVDEPMFTQKQADERAKAILLERSRDLVKASGTCIGLPDPPAGQRVRIAGLGMRFSGEYFVTETTHTINDSGYITKFNARHEDPGK